MKKGKRNSCLLGIVIFVLFQLSSCDPVQSSWFINCTNDTLFIGVSHYDDIDSVSDRLLPPLSIDDIKNSTLLTLWESSDCNIHDCEAVFPDSSCFTYDDCLFYNTDTCYFFLIKWRDAKRYSWDEIRANKLYRKWVVTKDKNGEYDRNIRYPDSDEQ